MAKIEVEEADYQQAAQSVVLKKRMDAILADPKKRSRFLEAWQEVNPDIVIPEVRAKEPVMEEIKAVREELANDRKARADEKAKDEEEKRLSAFTQTWEKQKHTVRQTYPDLNEKGMEEIEKLAKEEGIPNLEAAAALFRQRHPPAEVGAPNGGIGGWGFFEQPQDNMKENMEKLMASGGENEQVLNSMIRETLADVRGQRHAA